MSYVYLQGSENQMESVLFERTIEGQKVECMITVDLLLCGAGVFHYMQDGIKQFGKLTESQQIEILKFVESAREKIRSKKAPKSMNDFCESGFRSFDDYFLPGDEVTEDVIDNYRDILPPACMTFNMLQVGEPISAEFDRNCNSWRPTFSTFVKKEGRWYYAGNCFLKSEENMTNSNKIQERLKKLSK